MPRVLPQTVFAAGKTRFEVLIRGFANTIEAKILVFQDLPLEENGWTRDHTKLRKLRNEPRGMIFLVEKV